MRGRRVAPELLESRRQFAKYAKYAAAIEPEPVSEPTGERLRRGRGHTA